MDASDPTPSIDSPAGAGTRATRWSDDAFLDVLRGASDPLADACARDLPRDESLAFMFTKMRTDADIPAKFPEAFANFIRAARPSLELDDLTEDELAKLRRGQQVFMTNALPASLALLAKSLQEGYQAPRLGRVLMMTGNLETHTYRRVLGVLQMLLQVATPGSFEPKLKSEILPASDAGLTAIKVRLMHAGLRGIARHKLPDFQKRHGGVPISLEDLLGTLVAFSSLVVDAFETLGIPMSPEDADAYHFVWCVFARTMGIHPPGEPKSWEYVPRTLAEAHEFYAAYRRRHYAEAKENPEGIALADANLRMLAKRMPPLAARVYMCQLMGPDAIRRLAIAPVGFTFGWKWFLENFPRLWITAWRLLDRRKNRVARQNRLTQVILQRLILVEYNAGVPSYRIPRDLDEVRQVVEGTQPGLNFGRDQFLGTVFPAELVELAKRREAVGLNASRLSGPPSADKGLVGLALSGGGIRSSTFALGVVQALARNGSLRAVDYLSTVSGGGYLGSTLSSLLNDKEAKIGGKEFPLNFDPGSIEPPALRHLRSGSNFLTGGSLLNDARLPMILLRGFLLNMLLLMPYIMLAALATFFLFPFVHTAEVPTRAVWGTLAVYLFLAWSYPAVTWLYGRQRTWDMRNRSENRQALALVAFAMAVVGAILWQTVTIAVMSNPGELRRLIVGELDNPVETTDWWKWALVAVAVCAVLTATKLYRYVSKRTNRFMLYLVGFVAPTLMFGVYLLLLVFFVRSPILSSDLAQALDEDAQTNAESPANAVVVSDPELKIHLEALGISKGVVSATRNGWLVEDADGLHPTHHIRNLGDYLRVDGVGFGTDPGDWWFAGSALALFILNALWIDVNVTSPHGYWRDRLSRVFLFRARSYGRPAPNDGQKLSDLGKENPAVPYHLLNASLNLAGSRVEDLPGRGSDFFIFSKRFVGSYATGFCRTTEIEKADANIDLGTAMAISAATTAPNAGAVTVKPLVFTLTVLNVRLDYWAPNPWFVQASSLVRRLMARVGRPGPWYLVREATAQLHARGPFVNLSAGSHLECLGVYELLRRRCKLIVAADAEQDPEMSCAHVARLIRFARIDLGIEIRIDLKPLRANNAGDSTGHWTLGTIQYGHSEVGYLLYLKATVTGDEPPYVMDYRRENPAFPQEPKDAEFSDEAQFESYRALGYHVMNGIVRSLRTPDPAGNPENATPGAPAPASASAPTPAPQVDAEGLACARQLLGLWTP